MQYLISVVTLLSSLIAAQFRDCLWIGPKTLHELLCSPDYSRAKILVVTVDEEEHDARRRHSGALPTPPRHRNFDRTLPNSPNASFMSSSSPPSLFSSSWRSSYDSGFSLDTTLSSIHSCSGSVNSTLMLNTTVANSRSSKVYTYTFVYHIVQGEEWDKTYLFLVGSYFQL